MTSQMALVRVDQLACHCEGDRIKKEKGGNEIDSFLGYCGAWTKLLV